MKLADIPAPVWYLAGAAVAAIVVYQLAKRGVVAAGRAVDPTSRENVFHRGVNAVGSAVTGDDEFSLGVWLYDLTHGDEDPIGRDQPTNYNANARAGVPGPR